MMEYKLVVVGAGGVGKCYALSLTYPLYDLHAFYFRLARLRFWINLPRVCELCVAWFFPLYWHFDHFYACASSEKHTVHLIARGIRPLLSLIFHLRSYFVHMAQYFQRKHNKIVRLSTTCRYYTLRRMRQFLYLFGSLPIERYGFYLWFSSFFYHSNFSFSLPPFFLFVNFLLFFLRRYSSRYSSYKFVLFRFFRKIRSHNSINTKSFRWWIRPNGKANSYFMSFIMFWIDWLMSSLKLFLGAD